jgi:hypothetical protein
MKLTYSVPENLMTLWMTTNILASNIVFYVNNNNSLFYVLLSSFLPLLTAVIILQGA